MSMGPDMKGKDQDHKVQRVWPAPACSSTFGGCDVTSSLVLTTRITRKYVQELAVWGHEAGSFTILIVGQRRS